MYLYLFKRFLFFIPTLFLISLFSFLLSLLAPGDQTDQLMQLGDAYLEEEAYGREYSRLSEEIHTNLPPFYFSVLPSNIPKDLRKQYLIKSDRSRILNHLYEGRSLKSVQSWFDAIDRSIADLKEAEISPGQKNAIDQLYGIKELSDKKLIQENLFHLIPVLSEYIDVIKLEFALNNLGSDKNTGFMRPAFYWYGSSNQFHFWLKDIFTPGSIVSLKDGRPAMQKIGRSIYWTLIMLFSALLISLLIAVPAGVYGAYYSDNWWARKFEQLSFGLYSVPIFWLATLSILFLATPYYGMKIFPSVGLFTTDHSKSILLNMMHSFRLLILPVIILSFHSLAFVGRQMKQSMQKEINQAYFTTAIAKGLTINKALWKHAFPNASLPLVTLITGSIPALIAGTLIIEVIFNIPGMGRLMYDSIIGKDWPVVFMLVNLSGIVTVFSYLLADIAYMWLDPRIRLQH